MKVIRPLVLYGLCSCDGKKNATTDLLRLRILTTTHTWGEGCGRSIIRRYCRYIHLKRKNVSSKVTLTRLTIVIDLECQVFGHKDCYLQTSTFC